jgi:hypothetical protein
MNSIDEPNLERRIEVNFDSVLNMVELKIKTLIIQCADDSGGSIGCALLEYLWLRV